MKSKYYFIPGLNKKYTPTKRGLNAAIRRANALRSRVECRYPNDIIEVVWIYPSTCLHCGKVANQR